MIEKSLQIVAIINLIFFISYLILFIFSKDGNFGIIAIIFLMNFYKSTDLYKGAKNDNTTRKN